MAITTAWTGTGIDATPSAYLGERNVELHVSSAQEYAQAQTHPEACAPTTDAASAEWRICRRLAWQTLPVLVFTYLAAYIDRVNVSFAALQLNGQLGFSDAVFGFGAGAFSLGYVVFEVPSNMILQYVGARRWLTRIIVSWGVVIALTALIATPKQFYVMRYLLGIAEAGLVPGIVYYISQSFPSYHRARVLSIFYVALPLSGVIGAPLAGFIMQHLDGVMQIAGWKWMLIVESVPAFLAALFCWMRLDDDVTLSQRNAPADRAQLASALRHNPAAPSFPPDAIYTNGLVWAFCAIYFVVVFAIYGYTLWAPTIIQSLGVSGDFKVGLVAALPNVVAIGVMIAVGRSVDRLRERRLHLAVLMLITALGLTMSALLHQHLYLSVLGLCIANACLLSMPPVFWSMPTAVFSPAAAATGIAWISAIGNLGGFFGPYMVGHLKQSSGGLLLPVVAISGCLLLGMLLTLLLPKCRVDP
ncbi:MFS transporter [Paraburkholderia tropica]|uniref:MFS transporter n=1 Tax=Paraburkholderia tropica TaxID=92647 RepID=UPI0009F1B896|nr:MULTISPECIES: MFS transporter [Paraburkholderia]MBB2981115.1 MFS family permease [Paraburkholderia tropica]RQM46299.1 MFS transporter [Paraburkholderia bannensis]